jgi:large subunit ribosomal protein L21
MIAIAKIGGHQALVSVGDVLEVDKLDAEVGKKTTFPVLLISEKDGTHFQMGTPFIDGTSVGAKILQHGRGEKITVFKMKPRKRYRRTRGHRQDFTVIEIVSIGETKKSSKEKEGLQKTKKKVSPRVKKESPKKVAKKTSEKKPVLKKKVEKKDKKS